MNKKIFSLGLMGIRKVVLALVCDKGLPKKFDIPKYNPQFPKPDLGKFKFPDLPIFK